MFTEGNLTKNDLNQLKKLENWIMTKYPEDIKIHIITIKEINNIKNIILDPQGVVHKHFKIKGLLVYIVRPDNYIAYSSKELNSASIKNLLETYL